MIFWTTRRSRIAAVVLTAILTADVAPLAAAELPPPPASEKAEGTGTSLAEKLACAYLFVGGAIMLYYGPKEKENGRLTNDGRSEAIGGAIAIGFSVALLHDIIKRHPRRKKP